MSDDLNAFLADVGRSQLGWPESLRWTYDATRRLLADSIPGDLVECGVGAGCHPAVMARACIDAGVTRTVRLFDSFAGLPHGRADKDVEWSLHWGDGSGRLESTGVAACSIQEVAANLARWGIDETPVVLHPGWFQDTMPAAAEAWAQGGQGIAFLRLDGDLYDSTLVCLQSLYPLVSSGGIVVVDDWNLDGCREAVRDYFGGEPWRADGILGPEAITESGDVYWTKP